MLSPPDFAVVAAVPDSVEPLPLVAAVAVHANDATLPDKRAAKTYAAELLLLANAANAIGLLLPWLCTASNTVSRSNNCVGNGGCCCIGCCPANGGGWPEEDVSMLGLALPTLGADGAANILLLLMHCYFH